TPIPAGNEGLETSPKTKPSLEELDTLSRQQRGEDHGYFVGLPEGHSGDKMFVEAITRKKNIPPGSRPPRPPKSANKPVQKTASEGDTPSGPASQPHQNNHK
ncbi:hypothetical protein MCOR25_005074, partial [Pyricularia grisea]